MMEMQNVASSRDPNFRETHEQDAEPRSPASQYDMTVEDLLRYVGESACARRPPIENESLEEYLARTKHKPAP